MTHLSRNYDHNAKDFMFHRDQRSANIEHLEWDFRLGPIRGWGADVVTGALFAIILGCGLIFVLSL